MKTELTKKLEESAIKTLKGVGTFLCPEVGISIYEDKQVVSRNKVTGEEFEYIFHEKKTEIVDILLWKAGPETKDGEWRCYEIKITKQDFYSKNAHTFVGNYNYYIMPMEVYNEVKYDIADFVGVYTYEEPITGAWKYIKCIKKPKWRELQVSADILKYSMIKSLYRETRG